MWYHMPTRSKCLRAFAIYHLAALQESFYHRGSSQANLNKMDFCYLAYCAFYLITNESMKAYEATIIVVIEDKRSLAEVLAERDPAATKG